MEGPHKVEQQRNKPEPKDFHERYQYALEFPPHRRSHEPHTCNKDTPWFTAIKRDSVEMVIELMEIGYHISARMIGLGSGTSVLHLAAFFNAVNVFPWLIANDAKPYWVRWDGKTPLFFARSTEMVDLLLEAGADPTWKDLEGNKAIDYAIENGRWEVVKKLCVVPGGMNSVFKQINGYAATDEQLLEFQDKMDDTKELLKWICSTDPKFSDKWFQLMIEREADTIIDTCWEKNMEELSEYHDTFMALKTTSINEWQYKIQAFQTTFSIDELDQFTYGDFRNLCECMAKFLQRIVRCKSFIENCNGTSNIPEVVMATVPTDPQPQFVDV